jgi:transposase
MKINKVEICEHSIHLYVEMPVKPHRCPVAVRKGKKSTTTVFKRSGISNGLSARRSFFTEKEDLSAEHAENGSRNKIRLGKQNPFAEQNPFVERYQRFSKEWNQAVNARSIHAKTFKDLAFQFGAPVSTVIRRFDAVAKKEL